ncbi:MAG TPA: hypothetical protein VFG10_18970 [Saprospiraceae bacterium]|nr:hypothetical protein [Saprospiraceae bacterium]
MKSRILYFLLGILFIGAISAKVVVDWQPPRHDDTMIGTGTDDDILGCDTVEWIATKYDLTTVGGSTPGIDAVLAEAQDLTTDRNVFIFGNQLSIEGQKSGIRLGDATGVSTIGNVSASNNGNIIEIQDNNNRVFFDNTNHNGKFGINTNDPRLEGLDVSGFFAIGFPYTPETSSDNGVTGQIAWDDNFLYVCIATNTWVRTPLTTW